MNFSTRKLELLVIEFMTESLKIHGFQYSKELKLMLRATPLGNDQIRFSIFSRGKENRIFSVNIYIHIRINRMVEISSKFWPNTPKNLTETLPTIGTSLDYIFFDKSIPKFWLIDAQNELDIQKQLTEMKNIILSTGLPYFEKHRHLTYILEIMLNDSMYGWLHGGGRKNQYQGAIILSLLLGKREKLTEVISYCKNIIDRNGDDMVEFQSFLDYVLSLDLKPELKEFE